MLVTVGALVQGSEVMLSMVDVFESECSHTKGGTLS